MSKQANLNEIVEQTLTPIAGLIAGSSNEVMINANGSVWVDQDGAIFRTGIELSDGERRAAALSVARSVNQEVSEDRPTCDARLPDGSRVAIALPPVSVGGISITIRKFNKQGYPLPPEWESTFIRALVNRRSILVSGPTGAGKTTILNGLIREVLDERLVVIEDTAEIQIPGGVNCIRLEAKPAIDDAPAVTLRDLVKASLRHRPDRIILGEVRGAEALDLLWAIKTGHGGTLSTIHASSPLEALHQFAMYVQMANTGIPYDAICEIIAESVNVIVQMGKEDGRRVVQAVARPVWKGRFTVEDLEMAAHG